jgi:hypothetical protein
MVVDSLRTDLGTLVGTFYMIWKPGVESRIAATQIENPGLVSRRYLSYYTFHTFLPRKLSADRQMHSADKKSTIGSSIDHP